MTIKLLKISRKIGNILKNWLNILNNEIIISTFYKLRKMLKNEEILGNI